MAADGGTIEVEVSPAPDPRVTRHDSVLRGVDSGLDAARMTDPWLVRTLASGHTLEHAPRDRA